MKFSVRLRAILLCSAGAFVVISPRAMPQEQARPVSPDTSAPVRAAAVQPVATPQKSAESPDVRSTYILGPDDQVAIRAVDAEEIGDKPYRIDMRGNIRLPMVGRVRAAGSTVDQLEATIAERLSTFVQDPDVVVTITEFRSQPVSVIGSVTNPGVHQLQGRKTLVEILSLAGGLKPDAGHSVKITRSKENGPIPLKSALADPTGQYSVAQVSVEAILEARRPEENIIILPNDVISVPRADLVYVTGQVQRSGGFVLNERESMTVLQALSLAGGLDRAAAPQNSRILRAASAGSADRAEIAVNIRKIMEGKGGDVALQADDILFVPSSVSKKAALRAVEAAIQVGTGIVIWRR